MTWTYTDPSTSNRDAVRFAIGDTDSTDPLVTDEEIAYLLTSLGSVASAAVAACEHLAMKFAREVDRQVGNLRLSSSQRSKQFAELAVMLRRRFAVTGIPYAGGLSIAGKLTNAADSDRVKPRFDREDANGERLSVDELTGWRFG